MKITRRRFISASAGASAELVIVRAIGPLEGWAATSADPSLAPYLSGVRMAATPATNYRAYRSKAVQSPEALTWVQVDLKKTVAIQTVQLFPASERMYPGRDQYYAGEGFPLRFRLEASNDESFSSPITIVDFTRSDFPDPKDNITQFSAPGVRGRYVRLTATRLRAVKMAPKGDLPFGQQPIDSPDYTVTLAKIGVFSGGTDIAVGCPVSADERYGEASLTSQLTRAAREDGENIRMDYPQRVTTPKHGSACPTRRRLRGLV